MALKKLTNITDTQLKAYGVSALATRPNAPSTYGEGGLSAEELKARFDKLGKMLADAINNINDVLKSADGADYIALSGLGKSVASLGDLAKTFTSGEFATVLTAYSKASDMGEVEKLKSLQTIFNDYAERLSEVEGIFSGQTPSTKDYIDQQDTATLASAKSYADGKDGATLESAKNYADTAITALIGGAPTTLDTLKEIADWIKADETGTSALIGRLATAEANIGSICSTMELKNNKKTAIAGTTADEDAYPTTRAVKEYVDDKVAGVSTFSGNYNDLTNKPTLGTAAARDVGVANGVAGLNSDTKIAKSHIPTGTAVGDIVAVLAGGKVSRNILPNADGAGSYLGVVAGQSFANRNKAGATYHEVLIDSAGMAYAFYPNIDTVMSDSSINLVQNKIVKAYVDTAESSAKAYVDGIVGDIETLLAGV